MKQHIKHKVCLVPKYILYLRSRVHSTSIIMHIHGLALMHHLAKFCSTASNGFWMEIQGVTKMLSNQWHHR